MIEIRYRAKQEKMKSMADISGSWKDFGILQQDILKYLESSKKNIFIKVNNNANPEGWDVVLKGLEIIKDDDSVKVSVLENQILTIKGSNRNLEIFADWLGFEENTASGYHSHYEYFEGNEYINSNSIPLVIRIK